MLAALSARVEGILGDFLWRIVEPRLQAAMTDRLIAFYEGLLERDQITRPSAVALEATHSAGDAEHSLAGRSLESNRILQFSAHFRREKTDE